MKCPIFWPAPASCLVRAARAAIVPVLALGLSIGGLPARALGSPPCLTIVATSDVHGNLAPETVEAANGQGAVLGGGVLAFSGYVQALRASGELLLVDAGDLFQGTMAVNESRGLAMIDAYNALRYDAAAIGNHEFDYGPSRARPGSPTGSLELAIARAQFPFLGANMEDRASHALPMWQNFRRSVLLERNGIKVGIIGIATPTTPSATLITNVRDLHFAAAKGAIEREARTLRSDGAKLIVLIAHMGGRCRSLADAFDLSQCDRTKSRYGELFSVLASLPKGVVDVVVGGHTHERIAHWWGKTAVVQSGAYGRLFGRVDACLAEGGGLDVQRSLIHRPTPICLTTWSDGHCGPRRRGGPIETARYNGQAIAIDANVKAVVSPYLEAVGSKEQQPTGANLPCSLSADALAQLTAEGLRAALRADFGLQNRGGVRLAVADGELRYGAIFRAIPFDNHAVKITMSGAAIEQLVLRVASRRPVRDWPKLSGLAIHREGGGPLSVTLSKGQPLGRSVHYTLATTDFILAGGDGADGSFVGVPQQHIELSSLSLRDSLVQLLVRLYPAAV